MATVQSAPHNHQVLIRDAKLGVGSDSGMFCLPSNWLHRMTQRNPSVGFWRLTRLPGFQVAKSLNQPSVASGFQTCRSQNLGARLHPCIVVHLHMFVSSKRSHLLRGFREGQAVQGSWKPCCCLCFRSPYIAAADVRSIAIPAGLRGS